jgi:hypothetical protein
MLSTEAMEESPDFGTLNAFNKMCGLKACFVGNMTFFSRMSSQVEFLRSHADLVF